jgi:hypothetical protein
LGEASIEAERKRNPRAGGVHPVALDPCTVGMARPGIGRQSPSLPTSEAFDMLCGVRFQEHSHQWEEAKRRKG